MLFIFNELRTATAAATSDKLGEILLREGLITQDQLKKALLEQKNTGMRLGYTLVKLGFVEETEISKMLARQYRMRAVDLSRFDVDVEVVKGQTDDDVKAHGLAAGAPVVMRINGLPTGAVKRRAPDLGIAPFEHEMRVRYRVHGALHQVMKPPIKMPAALTPRINIM